MSARSDLYAALTGDATFAGLATNGLFAGLLPDQVTPPAGVLWVVNDAPLASGDVVQVRMQVDCCAANLDTAHAMAKAVKDVAKGTSGWQGRLGPDLWVDEGSYWAVPVDVIMIVSEV